MAPRVKLHGRAFYESIGSPKYIVAPMVDQSEFAWRQLTRSFLPPELRSSILAYSPMFHAKLFAEGPKYRAAHFEPLKPSHSLAAPDDAEHAKTYTAEDLYLDGNKHIGDRPLFVQFCANDPEAYLQAAKIVAPFCDAVDLNLGCPQGIARRGNYGAFLQEDWETIRGLISTLHEKLDVPVTAKMRILETREKTLEYAKMILGAGASILTVHGRLREQKGHATGLADWSVIRYLREKLPPETVIFANGNILQYGDLQRCLDETKADGVMSAEGNLFDPSIFTPPPAVGEEGREYWRGRNGQGGYRADAVLRRYLDIIHKHVLRQDPPPRKPLFMPSDVSSATNGHNEVSSIPEQTQEDDQPPPAKKQKHEHKRESKGKGNSGKHEKNTNPNLAAMQPHCFHILRFLVTHDHTVRDALARSRAGDIDAYENVLNLTEKAVREGLLAYEADPSAFEDKDDEAVHDEEIDETESSAAAVKRCKRPYWVCQPLIRPLPKEALAKGSLSLSKKEKAKLLHQGEAGREEKNTADELAKKSDLPVEGTTEIVDETQEEDGSGAKKVEVPKEGLVCS